MTQGFRKRVRYISWFSWNSQQWHSLAWDTCLQQSISDLKGEIEVRVFYQQFELRVSDSDPPTWTLQSISQRTNPVERDPWEPQEEHTSWLHYVFQAIFMCYFLNSLHNATRKQGDCY